MVKLVNRPSMLKYFQGAWIDKRTERVCLEISSKALTITGIANGRYRNLFPTDESSCRNKSVKLPLSKLFRGRRIKNQRCKLWQKKTRQRCSCVDDIVSFFRGANYENIFMVYHNHLKSRAFSWFGASTLFIGVYAPIKQEVARYLPENLSTKTHLVIKQRIQMDQFVSPPEIVRLIVAEEG